MRDLVEQVEQTIRDRQLLRQGQPILVAVSGGLDSMVLLEVFHQLAARHGWPLAVAHLNHQLRGRSSAADARLVQRTAARLGLPAVIESADVRGFARAHKLSLEMAARRVRHDFLARAAAQRQCATVALAHHADDQVELFFLRLLRGSGGQGLAGMRWRSPSPSDPRVELVRPLLQVPKTALREYAARRKLRFREDASNRLLEFQRNRLRHELLPWLRRNYQPTLNQAVLRLMDILGAEAEFVGQAAREWLLGVRAQERPGPKAKSRAGQGPGVAFEKLPLAVQRRGVQLQLLELGVSPEFELIEELRKKPECAIAIAHQCGAEAPLPPLFRDARGLLRFQPRSESRFRADCLELLLDAGAECEFGGVKLAWRIEAGRPRQRLKRQTGCEWFDAAAVGPRVVLRHWRPGDRFAPIGLGTAVKLQDFFTNQKVPRARRHELVVAATAEGEIFWVEGQRIGEGFKLTKKSNQRLRWQWQKL